MKISLIVAHGINYEIGYKNKLLWTIPADLQKFRLLTTKHHILMGRKTFESIGKPLPNRQSIILSKSNFDVSKYKNTFVYDDFEKAITFVTNSGETELFIIGGAQIYNLFINRADILYISEVNYKGEADAYLSPIKYGEYEEEESQFYKSDGDIPSWNFRKLRRR